MPKIIQSVNTITQGEEFSHNLNQYGATTTQSAASRALALSTYFLSGVLSINLSQFLGSPLKLMNEDWYNAWIAFTKQSFGLLTMKLTHAFAPTTVIVSGDASVRGQMHRRPDGTLDLRFSERIVLVANHQIYTDWLYLWWIAYCNKMHGYLYIILKESLRRIPVLGWGMQLSQFIFLKRNWEEDKPNMAQALQKLNKPSDPMWLLLFPEGTNLAPDTRIRSATWAKKTSIADCRHVLLPRSTGLYFCLNQLRHSVDYLYDCTIAYEGVPRGQYAQDIFTLKAGYLEGRPPASICMYWRRYAVKDIPIHSEKIFNLWLTARWREKDLLIENYYRFGRFPSDIGVTETASGRKLRGCGRLQVTIKPSHWYEFLQIFAPMGVLAMVLYIFYGALPQKIWNSINNEVIDTSTKEVQQHVKTIKDARGVSGDSFDLNSFFDKTKQGETFKHLGIDLAKHLQTSQARSIVSRAKLVQEWLENPQKFVSDNLEAEMPPKKRTFLQELETEAIKRKGINVPSSNHRGTFWKDIELAAARRATEGDSISARSYSVQNFANARPVYNNRNRSRSLSTLARESKSSGSFWSDLKREEDSRNGSIAPPQQSKIKSNGTDPSAGTGRSSPLSSSQVRKHTNHNGCRHRQVSSTKPESTQLITSRTKK